MKTRAIIPLVIGLAIGVFAIKYFVNVVKKAKGSTSTETVQVVFASADIAPTVEIKAPMLEVKSLPRAVVPKLCFTDKKEVEGRVACLPISTGLPVVPNMLAPKGTLPGLSTRIPDGLRAVAVQVDEGAGVAGWIKPGCRVDVVAVMSGRSGSQSETISKVILQNTEVLAVGQDSGIKTDVGASVVKSVTLAVLPSDVAKLHLAATKGKIRLAMRNQVDGQTEQKMAETTDNELLGIEEKAQKSVADGFLKGLMSKLPKPDPRATDKEVRATRAVRAEASEPPPPAPATKVHRVEMIEGGRIYEVVFEGEGPDQRRVVSGGERRNQNLFSGLKAATGPLSPAPHGG